MLSNTKLLATKFLHKIYGKKNERSQYLKLAGALVFDIKKNDIIKEKETEGEVSMPKLFLDISKFTRR